jgi:hypothetical protein
MKRIMEKFVVVASAAPSPPTSQRAVVEPNLVADTNVDTNDPETDITNGAGDNYVTTTTTATTTATASEQQQESERSVVAENVNDASEHKFVDDNIDDDDNGEKEGDDDDDDDDVIVPSSDLSNLNRRIWIVTTAGLPWMTGTAVNPLLRALSLCHNRPPHYVTLMIPWLLSVEERHTLYGTKQTFTTPHEQELWIRQYCVERCNCSYDIAYHKLQIQFWHGKYHEAFGSIFPLQDICATIPRKDADICILEEPEHLNWFRVPATVTTNPTSTSTTSTTNSDTKVITGNATKQSPRNKNSTTSIVEEKKQSESWPEPENPFAIEAGIATTTISPLTSTTSDPNHNGENNAIANPSSSNITTTTTSSISTVASTGTIIKEEDIEILGWAHKFQHVIGILHTNYADYIRQYGMASMVTAPALNALSSLVVKAYCHKVIRLSETLPPLDVTKEVTCNVHGVRHEFLQRPTLEASEEDETVDGNRDGSQDSNTVSNSKEVIESDKVEMARVYFIGKLIWAKGFERVLELQERYKLLTTEYFPIDIYGGGKDEKEIQTAFFGRNGTNRGSSSSLNEIDAVLNQQQSDMTKAIDKKAAAVFEAGTSLRDQICGDLTVEETVNEDDYVLVVNASPTAEGVSASIVTTTPSTPPNAATSMKKLLVTPNVDDPLSNAAAVVVEPPSAPPHGNVAADTVVVDTGCTSPIEVLGDLSGKTITTTVDTADATMKLIDSAMRAGLNILSGVGNANHKKRSETSTGNESGLSPKSNSATTNNQPNPFQNIAPAKTRFKVRRCDAWKRIGVPRLTNLSLPFVH